MTPASGSKIVGAKDREIKNDKKVWKIVINEFKRSVVRYSHYLLLMTGARSLFCIPMFDLFLYLAENIFPVCQGGGDREIWRCIDMASDGRPLCRSITLFVINQLRSSYERKDWNKKASVFVVRCPHEYRYLSVTNLRSLSPFLPFLLFTHRNMWHILPRRNTR